MLLLSSNSSAAQAQAGPASPFSSGVSGSSGKGKDYYYLIYQGEIQRYLGSRQDTDTDGDCGRTPPAADEHRQISAAKRVKKA
jgi:hypothetical protein